MNDALERGGGLSAPCRKCGTECDRTSLVHQGIEIGGGYLCGPCLDEAFADMAVRREQFEALLAAGVSRKEANRIMMARSGGTMDTA